MRRRCSVCNKKLRDNGECIKCRQRNKMLDKTWKHLLRNGIDPMRETFQIGQGEGHRQYGTCHKCLKAPVEVQTLNHIQQCKQCYIETGGLVA